MKATCNRRTIRRWFQAWPDDNLGLLTGRGLVALDVDCDKGGLESLDGLIEGRGQLPVTATARTGGGGQHYLFRVKCQVRNRVRILPGLDVRGEGGQIVVEPSVHPITGMSYVWARHPREGIADAPDWLIGLMTGAGSVGPRARVGDGPGGGERPRPDRQKATPRSRQPPDPAPIQAVLTRSGDRPTLAKKVIERFEVREAGTRHGKMTRAVGRLLGQGYDTGLVTAVLGDWHAHFEDLGVTRTGADEAAQEVEACIRSTHRAIGDGKFRPATGSRRHEDLCRRIRLDANQQALLDSGVVVTDAEGRGTMLPGPGPERGPRPGPTPHCKRVTPIGIRLCESRDESAFVEALLVHVTHKLVHTDEYPDDGTVLMTHDQIRQIAGDRHAGLRWGPQQVERLKRKYVTRAGDGKWASRFELLEEVVKGQPARGGCSGSPSSYRPTGILALLGPPPVRAGERVAG